MGLGGNNVRLVVGVENKDSIDPCRLRESVLSLCGPGELPRKLFIKVISGRKTSSDKEVDMSGEGFIESAIDSYVNDKVESSAEAFSDKLKSSGREYLR